MAFHQVPKDKKPTGYRGPYSKLDWSILVPSLQDSLIRPEEITKIIPTLCWTEDQVRYLESVRPSTSSLHDLQVGGYGLMPSPPFPISIWDMLQIAPSAFQSKCVVDDWWKGQSFAQEKKSFPVGWIALKKNPLKNSFGKEFSEQKKLLFSFEKLPEVSELVFFCVLFRLIRGEVLFENKSIRTLSESP